MQIKNLAVAGLLLGALALPCRGDEVSSKGRDIFNQNRHAVVTVEVVIKASAPGGRSTESKQEITGTVLDPSGLTVLALSACDPAEMYRRVSPDYKIDIEVSDVKILLEDGTELPAQIVLRDKDLDLAFIRPKTKPAQPMQAVDFSKSETAQLLDPVITLARLNKAASRSYAASVERISSVIDRPRTFYIPDSNMSSTELGSPAFTLDGKVLGIFVMRAVSGAGGSSFNYRQNITSIILPAADVLKAAKQAPEVKPDAEKSQDSSDTDKPKESDSSKKTDATE
jgi:S1-C subfamily serine protease